MTPRATLLGLLLVLSFGGVAAAQEASEYRVKAAFLFNFAKYVEWPKSDAADPLDVCVLGVNPFDGALGRALRGKRVSGRAFQTRGVRSVQDAVTCDIVFISASEAGSLEAILQRLSRSPILTVSDVPGFAERGGIIGLRLKGRKVRFEVNMLAARSSELKLSSQLLKVADQLIGQFDHEP